MLLELDRPYPTIALSPQKIIKSALSGVQLYSVYRSKHIGRFDQWYEEASYPIELQVSTMRGNFTNAYFPDFYYHDEQIAGANTVRGLFTPLVAAADAVIDAEIAAAIIEASAGASGVGIPLMVALAVPFAALTAAAAAAAFIKPFAEAIIETIDNEIARLEADKIAAQAFFDGLPDPFLYDVYDACPIVFERQTYLEIILEWCAHLDAEGVQPCLDRLMSASVGLVPEKRASLWVLLRICYSRLLMGVMESQVKVFPGAIPGLPRLPEV